MVDKLLIECDVSRGIISHECVVKNKGFARETVVDRCNIAQTIDGKTYLVVNTWRRRDDGVIEFFLPNGELATVKAGKDGGNGH